MVAFEKRDRPNALEILKFLIEIKDQKTSNYMSFASPKRGATLIMGGTGVGKSYILNRLIKKNGHFPSGGDSEISNVEAEIEIDGGRISLCAFDTPGKFF